MRLKPLVVSAACVLLAAGCAPESMATHAVLARHSAPSVLTPTADAAGAAEEAAKAEVQLGSLSSAPGSQWRDLHLDDVAFSDADQLDAVSPSFRSYAEQAMSAADTDGCTVLGLGVMSVHPAGYVVGSLSTDCGGGQAIWVENGDGSTWKVAMVLQAPPLCTELMSIGLPAGVGLLCDGGSGELSEY
ncbi:MAG: hypothetical protein Q4G35_06650 [Propionibacteriaceae bacterium]|nr:hypothetical protein [Propionibacteriaceae bacterium]